MNYREIYAVCFIVVIEELHNTKEQLTKAESERTELAEQVKKLVAEVEDVKTAAAIQQVGKEDEIAKAHRQHEEELASFQQIMEGIVIDIDLCYSSHQLAPKM